MPICNFRIAGVIDRCARPVLLAMAASALAGCATQSANLEAKATPKVVAIDPVTLDYAEQAVNQGRYADAQKILQRVSIGAPANARAKLLLAEIVLATGRPEDAVRRFDEISASPGVAARVLQGKGLALLKLRKIEDGRRALEQAVMLDPSLWRGWNALGYCHDTVENWKGSSEAYDRALKENPRSAQTYNNRGFSRLLQKRFDDSIEDLQRAVSLDPELKPARLNLRLALAWKGRYARAMLGVPKKERGIALNNIGYVAMLRGDLPGAESLFLRALEAGAAYNETAYRNLTYLQNLKEVEEAEAAREAKQQ